MATEAAEPAVFIIEEIAGGVLDDIRADETRTIRPNAFCTFPRPINFAGLGLVRNLPRTAKITLTLI